MGSELEELIELALRISLLMVNVKVMRILMQRGVRHIELPLLVNLKII